MLCLLLSIVACAMSIPSALAPLVRVFPEPLEQARAISLFGGCGAFGSGTSRRCSRLCKAHYATRSVCALHRSAPCPVRLVPLGLLVRCYRRHYNFVSVSYS